MQKKVNPSAKLYQEGQKKTHCPFCGEKLDLTVNKNQCWNCGAPINKKSKIYQWIKPRITKSNFTKILTALIWMAITGWAITSYSVDWLMIAILSVMWLCFIPAYHLVEDLVG